MSALLRTVLIMSLSGSIVAALLFALKPLIRDRLPKSVQYYLWLVVIAALLVPVSTFIKLPGTANTQMIVTPSDMVDRYVISAEEEKTHFSQNMPMYSATDHDEYMREVKLIRSPISSIVTVFMCIYPLGALIVLLYYIISFKVFIGIYRRRNCEANADERTLLAELCDNCRAPLLCRNSLVATPMLMGALHYMIILPDREYTNEQLRAVLLHELTHLRRKDMLMKWLSVFVTALHWFNPVVWLVRREIDRACEFSCDEAVIRNLDADGKQNYGETLLYVAADTKTPHAVLSTTMCEEKKALKQRLFAIMKSKKHTRLTIIVSVMLLVVIVGAAIALGAGSKTVRSNDNFDTSIVNGERNSSIPSTIPEKTPFLDVNLVTVHANGNSQTQISRDVRAAQLTNSWYVVDKKGNGSGYSADSFHPLQKQDGYGDVTLNLNNSGVITLVFSDNYPPQSVSVQRWNAEYAGTDSIDVWNKGESVNMNGNMFQISDDGNDYIYEIYAKWQEGDSWYVFRIDSISREQQTEEPVVQTDGEVAKTDGEVAKRVEDGISVIMSSPQTSSNPQDYINEHRQEYENITAKYPEGVLDYLLSQFEAGNTGGLRGHIMMRMCKDMLGLQNNITDDALSPQEWYEQLSIIGEIKLPDFKPENPDGEYGALIYAAITEHYSRPNDGFVVAAPTVYGAYEEDSKLKIFITVFYERYRLYGKTLESTGGGVIPGAVIFRHGNRSGEWIVEDYLEVGAAFLPDGSYFSDSIQKLCVMPVSGAEIKGLAETINTDYTNSLRNELLMQNLKEHLTMLKQTGVSLKKPGGEMIPLT